jgi:hypothetical protein
MRRAHLLILILVSGIAAAQVAPAPQPPPVPLPDNEIHAVALVRDANGLRLGTPENLTMRAGYDNQPAFLPDGKGFLYTANADPQQTDIHFMSWPGRESARLNTTVTSEYSPTPVPGGGAYSTVVVEPDGAQRLWQYRLDGSGGFVLLPDIKGVGYHAWLNATRLALFIVGDEAEKRPSALHVVDTRDGKVLPIATNIGRSLHRVPATERLSWVDKTDPKRWRIVASDGQGGEVEELVVTLEGSEDYCWLPDGSILMAKGSEVFRWSGERGTAFVSLGVLPDLGGSINRMAVDAKGETLVFVVTLEAPRTRGIRG